MRICHITSVHPPFDVRIFHKECKSLAQAGYEVFLVAPHIKDEIVDGVEIRQMSRIKNPFVRILLSPWKAFYRALATKAAVFHLHDPELLPVGVLLRLLGKKVIFDSHENVAGQILTKEWIPSRLVRKAVAIFYNIVEKFCVFFYSGVIVVNEDIRKRFSFKKRVKIIRNYPILNDISKGNNEKINRNNKHIIIYAGGLSKIRGIKELILAMDQIDARLWLLGPWETEVYRRDCESIPGSEKCDYLGSVPFGEHYAYLKSADIGVINFYPEKNHLESLPNKIFEYMASSLALVVSDFVYWKTFLEGCALFVDPLNADDIAEKINRLLIDKALKEELSRNGLKKVNVDFSWEEEHKRLIEFYSGI